MKSLVLEQQETHSHTMLLLNNSLMQASSLDSIFHAMSSPNQPSPTTQDLSHVVHQIQPAISTMFLQVLAHSPSPVFPPTTSAPYRVEPMAMSPILLLACFPTLLVDQVVLVFKTVLVQSPLPSALATTAPTTPVPAPHHQPLLSQRHIPTLPSSP